MRGECQVFAVVVAYNRAKLLRECLDAIAAQTRPVQRVIVIDNASTDESARIAQQHPVVDRVITLSENTGGAGGFCAGIAHALAYKELENHDFIWIMDDDTIPTPAALEELLAAGQRYPGSPALLASKAQWTDGTEHPMNAHRERPLISPDRKQIARRLGLRQVRAASFVSILVEVAQVCRSGLPIADYFIWNDDLEYTARLLKNRIGLYVPASVVVHKTRAAASATDDPGDRFYYETRNKIWFLLRSRGLLTLDRVLYGGSMLVRWFRMWLSSGEKKKMLRLGVKGVADGVLSGPRPNEEIFVSDPDTAKLVAACENASRVKADKRHG
ncbi:glycosyltransferase family 2 protein [Varibaculum cambriense]|uniref:glycosyltransferase family 2 protein n=1 Tax=Varibaculum cambriense TaxID=184870 RepID=UPI00290402BE|nr:glycosyltransferase family 2 protein [Varibaculum cambriense]MDU1223904.1 glycosyltransferase family 2 protein [Varibaculum cambriense]